MNAIKGVIFKFLSFDKLLNKIQIYGDIPSVEEVYKTSSRVIWPSVAEAMLVGIVTMIDTMMVGSLGASAIASVGITTQPKFICLALIFSLNTGVATIVARRRGENDIESANKCLRQGIMLSIIFSAIITIVGIILAEPLMLLAGANQDTIYMSSDYFKIMMCGFMFMSLNLTINAAQRGAGNTKISMRTNIVANIINLIFNFLLINGAFGFPRLGVNGAAIATVIGYFVACIMSIKSIRTTNNFLYISMKDRWRFDKDSIHSIYKIASSSIVEQIFMRIGFFMYSKLIAGLGTIEFATHQICINMLNITFTFSDGFNVAISSLVGQAMGEKRPDMAKIKLSVAFKMCTSLSIIISIVMCIFRVQLIQMFTNDIRIIEIGSDLILMMLIISGLQGIGLTHVGCLRGAGDAKYIANVAFVSIGIMRPILAWLLCYPFGWGIYGAWVSMVIDQIIRSYLYVRRYKSGKWEQIKI